MSAHTGHRPRRSAHPAIRAGAAAIIVLALAACGSTTTTPATSTTTTAIPSGGPGILTGAGSTYVAPFFALALARYHQQHPAVTVNYAVVGSSAGIAAISARQVDFGASIPGCLALVGRFEDDPDSDLYAESSQATTVIAYIQAHSRDW